MRKIWKWLVVGVLFVAQELLYRLRVGYLKDRYSLYFALYRGARSGHHHRVAEISKLRKCLFIKHF